MANEVRPNVAWFEDDRAPKVEGFEAPECPHGFLRFEMSHNRTDSTYRCTECDKSFVCKIEQEDDDTED